ncbi:MAG TPA: glycosyltransferase family 4 protein [Bacilli bacterium]
MESRGKVLIIVENLPVPFDRRVWMEATALAQNGYQVSVICPVGKRFELEYEVIEGVHIYRHPLPPEISSTTGYLKEYIWALRHEFRLARKIWKERGFDIVHVCNPPDLLFLVAGWFKVFHGVKVVFDQHDINPELYEVKFGKRGLFHKALRLAERCSYAVADVVIATNESYKEIAVTRGKQRPEKVFVVRSGPDLSRFQPVPPQQHFKRGKPYLVGYVGVMGEQEGIDLLLQAAKYLVLDGKRDDIRFMLIGGGPALERMRRLCSEMGIAQNVEFTGRVPDDELLARLSSCDVCVNPDPKNTFNDKSTMNKVLEYMALAKPIVQFDLLEGRRSAEDASLYAEGNDANDLARKIEWLLDNPALREQMGRVGQDRMSRLLEWRHQVPNLLEAYAAVRGKPSLPVYEISKKEAI